MSEAFTVYLRSAEKVLLMQRADEVADFPGAWDGIYGIGEPSDTDAVVARITECTGIPAENLACVRSGMAQRLLLLAGATFLQPPGAQKFGHRAVRPQPRGMSTYRKDRS